jgi:hypothetical protein
MGVEWESILGGSVFGSDPKVFPVLAYPFA